MYYLMGHCKKEFGWKDEYKNAYIDLNKHNLCKHKHFPIEELVKTIFGRRNYKKNDTIIIGYRSKAEYNRISKNAKYSTNTQFTKF